MPEAAFDAYFGVIVELGEALADKKRLRGADRWKTAFKDIPKAGGSWGGYMNTPPGSVKPIRCVSRALHDHLKGEAVHYLEMYPSLKEILDRLETAFPPYVEAYYALDSRTNRAIVGASRGPAYERETLERVLHKEGTSLGAVYDDVDYWINLIDRTAYQGGRLGNRRSVLVFGRSLIETLRNNPNTIVCGERNKWWLLTHVLSRVSWRAYLWGDRAMEDYCVGVLHELLREFPDLAVHSRILSHTHYHDKKSTAPFKKLKAYDEGARTSVPQLHDSIGPHLNHAIAVVLESEEMTSTSLDDRLIVLGDRTIRQALDLNRKIDEHGGDLEGAAMCTIQYAVAVARHDRDYDGARRAIADIRRTLKTNNFSAPLAEMRLITAEADICEIAWRYGDAPVSSLIECGVLLERAANFAEASVLALTREAKKYRDRAANLGR